MKKVLSLLLVCTMILSLSAIMVANADGEAYVLKYVDLKWVEGVDDMGDPVYSIEYTGSSLADISVRQPDKTWADGNGFAIAISANVAASAGMIAIDYDENVIVPAYMAANSTTIRANPVGIVANPATSIVVNGVSTSEIIVDSNGFAFAWSNNGNLAANTVIAYVNFVLKSGKTLDDLNADSIKFAVVDSVNSAATDALKGNFANYGAAMAVYSGAAHGLTDTSNNNRTYPNSDKVVGGNVAVDGITLDKTTATITTIGDTVTLTATVSPENATNKAVTWTTDKESVATVTNGVVTAVADGTATITATSEDGSFTATCVITVDADWEAAPADKTEWKNGFEFKGQDGTTKTDNTVKKLVIFGKNSTTTELAAKSYGVKIGINEYKGVLPVPAGSSWAIIILDENGQKVALDNYSYTAFVGDKTVFSGNVNAQ